jgi:hypothetical protein
MTVVILSLSVFPVIEEEDYAETQIPGASGKVACPQAMPDDTPRQAGQRDSLLFLKHLILLRRILE